MTIVAGVDIGSTTTKAVILQDNKIAATGITMTGADCDDAAETAVNEALKKAELKREQIEYIVSTGYGRRAINFGNKAITEISANAKGAIYLGSTEGKIKSIIDIGGQDTKAIILDEEGKIINFVMNDKCAAGTGRFLDVIARSLEEPIENFIKLSLESTSPATINSTCTVFAESEVISLVSKKVSKQDIAAGIHKSIGKKVADMSKAAGIKPLVFFDGGGAKNIALKKAIEKELGYEIYVPESPQLVVALGAAIIAEEKMTKK